GIEYHRLIISERELLEKTLQGSVRALTDMLALVSPTAFGKASRVRGYMRQLADALSVPDRWMYELAGSLSQIGCVTIPSDTLEEEEMYANHSKVAEDLLSDIPRMEAVARIIGRQSQSVETVCESETEPPGFVDMGAQSLALAVEFDTLTSRGLSRNEAVTRIKKRPGRKYNDQALDALSRIQAGEIEVQTRMVRVQDLASLMILAEDVYTTSGMLIAPKGQEATLSVRALLSNYAIRKDIDSEVRVQLSTRVSADAAQDEDIVATQPEAASGQ
ncbi:MAG: HD domain-containing phosphohydrolase, partial [Candidatus Zixiibacteriota bacterium]